MPTISGLSSGIDTDAIVKQLLKIRQTRIDVLSAQKKSVTDQQDAFKTIESDIVTLQSKAGALGRSLNNVFDSRAVTTSIPDNVDATATTRAAAGVYQIKVNSLAQAHQISSQGFATAEAEISTGTFTVQSGSSGGKTITIDSTNNTLSGLADAINGAGAGVTASIVEDASNPSARFKLLLTASKPGTANAITLTNNLAASAGNAVLPAFNLGSPVQAAMDATVQLGSGAGAIVATSSTNSISTLISGVTLNLKQADASKTVTVTVSRDTGAATKSLQDFVDSYNGLMDEFDKQFAYDQAKDKSGLLLGNSSASGLQASIREALTSSVAGVNSNLSRLSAVGVTFNDEGKLDFDASKLTKVMNGEVPGVLPDDVRKLFALDATSTNGGIQFMLGSSKTASPAGGIQVDITQAAQQATITASNTISDSILIDDSNDTLAVRLDGRTSSSVKLAHGTYTRATLATQLQTVLNTSGELGGRLASVGVSGSSLTIQSDNYGSISEIAVTGGTAAAALGFSGTETDKGLDVVGKFIVNGKEELATGNGRLLMGKSGNANTDGLQIRVTMTDAQVQAGVDGTLNMTRGIGSRVEQTLGKLLDPTTGRIKFVNDGFDDKVKNLQKAIDRQNQIFDKQQTELTDQFTALETQLSQLQSTASYLSAQLTSINGNN